MKKGFVLVLAIFMFFLTSCSIMNSTPFSQPENQKGAAYHDFKGFGIIDYKAFPQVAQAKLAALEAARQDAYSKAVEYIYGVYIDSKTTVKDFVLKEKNIESSLWGVIRGAQQIDEGFNMTEGMAYVTIRIFRKDIEELLGKKLKNF
ncbi:hypothetical protein X275_10450 [Marinitoga sp. 1197]|uniref:LPP20 family lipoprotein n=1 Tax=Marinitoga sp. 1197 TaxID=1428449 RepID=UPI0006590C55|nr:hypothetical protein [Marinitoga sp. 1197]KLO21115.1 hypothetical protein X275_10450 [Marinitoga sp. 1197]